MQLEADGLAALSAETGIRYALIGGHAVNAWIPPRQADDFDLLVEPSRTAIESPAASRRAAGLTASTC